jgi:hypothetical protein
LSIKSASAFPELVGFDTATDPIGLKLDLSYAILLKILPHAQNILISWEVLSFGDQDRLSLLILIGIGIGAGGFPMLLQDGLV